MYPSPKGGFADDQRAAYEESDIAAYFDRDKPVTTVTAGFTDGATAPF
ncbi:hypothetical protein [Microbacterium sp. MM2322]